jgi:hypothetical protein
MNNEKINKIVVYNFVGTYVDDLTRGKEYEVLVEDEEKQQIIIVGDNLRAGWFRRSLFLPAGSNVTTISRHDEKGLVFMCQNIIK